MAKIRLLDTLDRLMTGEAFGPAELDEFLENAPAEAQWHDYKSGKAGKGKGQGAAQLRSTIRQYVTAFANSDGGILLVGVTEPDSRTGKREVDGITIHRPHELRAWASDVLAAEAPFLSPPPRVEAVSYGAKEVLVVAVRRNPQLIPYIKAGKPQYAMRFGHCTFDAPEWMVTDLVLGRRAHPILDLRFAKPQTIKAKSFQSVRNLGWIEGKLGVEVANLSLATAHDVRIGLVAWVIAVTDPPQKKVNASLLPYLDSKLPTDEIFDGQLDQKDWFLSHMMLAGGLTLKAFSRPRIMHLPLPTLPLKPPRGMIDCAIYVMAEGSPPEWYQLTWKYSLFQVRVGDEYLLGEPTIIRTYGRPHVGWRHNPDPEVPLPPDLSAAPG